MAEQTVVFGERLENHRVRPASRSGRGLEFAARSVGCDTNQLEKADIPQKPNANGCEDAVDDLPRYVPEEPADEQIARPQASPSIVEDGQNGRDLAVHFIRRKVLALHSGRQRLTVERRLRRVVRGLGSTVLVVGIVSVGVL